MEDLDESLRQLLENYKEYYFDLLITALEESEESKNINFLDYNPGAVFKKESPKLNRLEFTHPGIKEFYINKAGNGYIKWSKNEEVGGNIKIVDIENLFDEDLSRFYDEEMIEENEDIQYFRPWDYATPEAQCGFVIKPEEIYSSIYYNQAGRSELHNLDLDYEGYTQMALEARAFYNWQRVLLHYDGWTYGEEETKLFKTEMPEIFPDWTWEGFIEKYESLRLSNKDK